MKEQFYHDLKAMYHRLQEERRQLQKMYKCLQPHRSLFEPELEEYEALLEDFLEFVGLPKSSETVLAAVNRIVNLREDTLLQVLSDWEEEEKIAAKERAFVWVSQFYLANFERRLEWVESQRLLTPFYRSILRGAHEVGEVMSQWQSSWMAQIVHGINRELFHLFNGDEEKILQMLQSKNLLDLGHDGEVGDRCYSVLRLKEDGSYERLCYAQAFEEEVQEVSKRLEKLVRRLDVLEDEVFGQKEQWIVYFRAIIEALQERDIDQLIPKWADVDRAWMRITTPIQIGHPLEYYEDHYRKAVALEWDVRLSDPDYPQGERAKKIEAMFRSFYQRIGIEALTIYEQTISNLQKVQLYVGRPFSFYGREFNGLFSAQVVPNDEKVSQEYGKKIFAYPDFVLQTQRAKPKMRLTREIFGEELAKKFRELLEDEKSWRAIYDITTIGHEYGHILWMDENSETVMNASGMFKLAEEFKATTGGLVAYFMYEAPRLSEELLLDHIQRSVSLIGWMEVPEVVPYYVEGLLHLQGLFESGVLRFEERLRVDMGLEAFEKLKEWYVITYEELVRVYLKKENVKKFLDKMIIKDKNYYPKDKRVDRFVRHYYGLCQKIGRELDKE